MAVWQFRFSLLPRKGVLRKHKTFPDFLPEYKANFNHTGATVDENYENYWEAFDIGALSDCFEKNIPCVESWSEELAIYGCEEGSKVEVSEDEVYVKFDTRKPNYTFLRQVVDLAKSFDCIFAIEEDGRLIDPAFEVMLEYLHNSRAYRFCENPDEVLTEISNQLSTE